MESTIVDVNLLVSFPFRLVLDSIVVSQCSVCVFCIFRYVSQMWLVSCLGEVVIEASYIQNFDHQVSPSIDIIGR